MERLTEICWRNLDPWECCGQDYYCKRGCHDKGGCINGCVVPKVYCRLAAYEDTGLTPDEIVGAASPDALIKLAAQALETTPERLRELAAADKEGRVSVLPFSRGRTLLCEENIDALRLMKDVDLAIRYCSSCGIVFYMGFATFCDLVKHGRITAVSDEAERRLEVQPDGNQ